ncbi:MAG: DUF883 family protein [Rhodanobacteraceae bacterium]
MNASDDNPRVQDTHEHIDEAAERVEARTSDAVSGAADQFHTAAERVEYGVHRATEAGAHTAHRAADTAEDWREHGAAMGSSARDRIDAVLADVRAFARDHPLESVAAALAAGWLMGRLLKRHRD